MVTQSNSGGPWMKSGVMIRSGTDPQAPYYGVFVTPRTGWRCSGGVVRRQHTATMLPSATTPLYVLVARYTDTAHNIVYYSAYTSTDGHQFSYVPGSTVPLDLPGPLVGGIVSDSYDSAKLCDATFEEVALLPGAHRRRSCARRAGTAPTSVARCPPARTS